MTVSLPVLSRHLLVYGVILVGAVACSAMVPVHIGGDLNRPVATFGLHQDQPERACVEELSISNGAAEAETVMWSVKVKGRGCRNVRQIFYGEMPAGFDQLAVATPLQAGIIYRLRADGQSRTAISSVPWHWTADYVFEDGEWKPAPLQGARRLAQ